MTDTMNWVVDSSHCCNVPTEVEVESMAELREWVQGIANSRSTEDKPFGVIQYRYSMDPHTEEVTVVYAYFTNRHSKLCRFMKLTRGY